MSDIVIPSMTFSSSLLIVFGVAALMLFVLIVSIFQNLWQDKGYELGYRKAIQHLEEYKQAAYNRGKEELQSIVTRLNEQHENLKTQYTSLKVSSDTGIKTINNLRARLEQAQDELVVLKTANADLEKSVEYAKAYADDRNKEAEIARRNAEMNAASLREDLDDALDRVNQLHKDYDRVVEQLEKKEDLRAEFQNKLDAYIQERDIEYNKKYKEVIATGEKLGTEMYDKGQRETLKALLEVVEELDSNLIREFVVDKNEF